MSKFSQYLVCKQFHLYSRFPLVYAFTLGQFGMIVMGYAADANAEKRLHQQIKISEFVYACTVLSSTESKTLQVGEFILLELMRLGVTNIDQIEALKGRFYKVAPEGASEIGVEDLIRKGLIDVTIKVSTIIVFIL